MSAPGCARPACRRSRPSQAEIIAGVENARRAAGVASAADPLDEIPAARAQLAKAGIVEDPAEPS